jgi:hypothetical protein
MPAGSTYEKVQTTTLSSDGTLTLTSIPSTYTDLVVVIRGKSTGGEQNVSVRFNGDTASNYSRIRLLGYPSATQTEVQTNQTETDVGDWGTNEAVIILNIFSYSNTSTWKNFTSRSNEATYVSIYTGHWRSTSAINEIVFFKPGASIAAGTTATIYGIARA